MYINIIKIVRSPGKLYLTQWFLDVLNLHFLMVHLLASSVLQTMFGKLEQWKDH